MTQQKSEVLLRIPKHQLVGKLVTTNLFADYDAETKTIDPNDDSGFRCCW